MTCSGKSFICSLIKSKFKRLPGEQKGRFCVFWIVQWSRQGSASNQRWNLLSDESQRVKDKAGTRRQLPTTSAEWGQRLFSTFFSPPAVGRGKTFLRPRHHTTRRLTPTHNHLLTPSGPWKTSRLLVNLTIFTVFEQFVWCWGKKAKRSPSFLWSETKGCWNIKSTKSRSAKKTANIRWNRNMNSSWSAERNGLPSRQGWGLPAGPALDSLEWTVNKRIWGWKLESKRTQLTQSWHSKL